MIQKFWNKTEKGHKTGLKKKNWMVSAGLLAAAMTAALALTACGSKDKAEAAGASSDKAQVIAEGENLVISVGDISETASFYPVEVDGTLMEVVAVQAPDGSLRTAFNTCQICYGSGRGYYVQDGNVLVCQNCGNRFPMSRVEVEAGGCNPWPIFDEDKTVTDESITISYDFLKESYKIFENWKIS